MAQVPKRPKCAKVLKKRLRKVFSGLRGECPKQSLAWCEALFWALCPVRKTGALLGLSDRTHQFTLALSLYTFGDLGCCDVCARARESQTCTGFQVKGLCFLIPLLWQRWVCNASKLGVPRPRLAEPLSTEASSSVISAASISYKETRKGARSKCGHLPPDFS